MKRIILLFVISLMSIGCSRVLPVDELPFKFQSQDVSVTSKSVPSDYIINEPYSFSTLLQDEKWKNTESFAERKKMCNLPQDLLSKMDTKAVALTCIKYPFHINYLLFNTLTEGVRNVVDGFNAFEELIKRKDAFSTLLSIYTSVKLETITKGYVGTDDLFLSFNELGFLICFMESEYAMNLTSYDKESVNKAFSNIVKECYAFETTIGKFYHNLVNKIQKERESNIITKSGYFYFTTVYTPSYTPVEAKIKEEEYTAWDKFWIKQDILAAYSNVQITDDPSTTYNCHSFAWHMSFGGSECWIDAINRYGAPNVSNYYSDPYFWGSGVPYSNSYKYVSYRPNVDHSALIYSINPLLFESKWGSGPVVIHSPVNCPYDDYGYLLFYRHAGIDGGLLICNDGDHTFNVGDSPLYVIPGYQTTDFDHEWEVYDAKGDDAIGTKVLISHPNNNLYSAQLYFVNASIYEIYCKVYDLQGNLVAQYMLTAEVTL